MLTGKYVSTSMIVDAMFSQYGFSPQDIKALDIKEHIYDAIALIGAPSAYINKIAIIQIIDHRGELPADLFDLNSSGVRLYPGGDVMYYSTNIYYQSTSELLLDSGVTLPDEAPIQVETTEGTVTIKEFDMDSATFVNTTDNPYPLEFTINNNYIITGLANGAVEMAYKAFPTEICNGEMCPLVPDNVRYISAVKAYVAERIGFFLWMRGQIDNARYQKLDQERCWYIASAGNAARLPSYDRMENMKNQMTLIPDMYHHKNGFTNLNKPTLLRTHTSRRRR